MIDWDALSGLLHRHFDEDVAQGTLEKLWKRFGERGELPPENNHVIAYALTAARNIRASLYAHHYQHVKWEEHALHYVDVERRTPDVVAADREALDRLRLTYPLLVRDVLYDLPRSNRATFVRRQGARALLGRPKRGVKSS